MSSLSHSITVRSSIAAFSIGTISHSGPRVITMPPVCWPRCLGKPSSSPASATMCLDSRIARIHAGFADLLVRERRRGATSPVAWRVESTISRLRPIALPTSRTARSPAIGDHLAVMPRDLGRTSDRDIGSPLRGARARNRCRYPAARCGRPRRSARTAGRSAPDRRSSRPGNSRRPSWPPTPRPWQRIPRERANLTRS